MKEIKDEAIKFLKNKNIKGEIIFCMYAGSIAFNLSKNKADVDIFGIYSAPFSTIVSINSEVTEIISSTKDEKPDMEILEISKYCQTLQTGNPLSFLALFCNEELSYESNLWKEFKKSRKEFLTKNVVKGFINYIKSQIKIMKLNDDNYSKPLYHSFRLLFEVENILEGFLFINII
jgi:predicted nucleotidyltransferase